MDASLFISGRLRLKSTVAMVCIAVSFLVMIIAVSVSSGFRNEIRNGISDISGDIQLTPPNLNVLDVTRPVDGGAAYLDHVRAVRGVQAVRPVVYKAGIVREDGNIHGVLFKGVGTVNDSIPLAVSVPERFSEITGLGVGDVMTSYFVGTDVRLRRFTIVSLHETMVETDNRLVIHASLADLQRLEGWTENQVSAIEIIMDEDHKSESHIHNATQEIGAIANAYSSDSETPVIAISSLSRYPQLFDWLDLIDFNVLFILMLMTVVAGFNMISGLLIMLFENISTIGLLKALGMTDRAISKVFLSSAAVLVLKGMLVGNALALIFCVVQSRTHLIGLDPENYFVPYVPVNVDYWAILSADATAFIVIMLLLLIPTVFISRVDPAKTVRVK